MKYTDCEGRSRLQFLRVGAAGLFGLSLADLLRADAKPGRKTRATGVIMIWLGGGPSTIDMWDLKPDAPAEIRGTFNPIATSVTGLRVSEHLPRMAMTADKVTLVRSVQHSLPVHGPGSMYMTTGNFPIASLTYPSLGSLASRLRPARPARPGYVTAGGKGAAAYAGYLGAAFNPFVVDSMPE